MLLFEWQLELCMPTLMYCCCCLRSTDTHYTQINTDTGFCMVGRNSFTATDSARMCITHFLDVPCSCVARISISLFLAVSPRFCSLSLFYSAFGISLPLPISLSLYVCACVHVCCVIALYFQKLFRKTHRRFSALLAIAKISLLISVFEFLFCSTFARSVWVWNSTRIHAFCAGVCMLVHMNSGLEIPKAPVLFWPTSKHFSQPFGENQVHTYWWWVWASICARVSARCMCEEHI